MHVHLAEELVEAFKMFIGAVEPSEDLNDMRITEEMMSEVFEVDFGHNVIEAMLRLAAAEPAGGDGPISFRAFRQLLHKVRNPKTYKWFQSEPTDVQRETQTDASAEC